MLWLFPNIGKVDHECPACKLYEKDGLRTGTSVKLLSAWKFCNTANLLMNVDHAHSPVFLCGQILGSITRDGISA